MTILNVGKFSSKVKKETLRMSAKKLHAKARRLLDESEWDFRSVDESLLSECFRWEWPRSRPDLVEGVRKWRNDGADYAKFKDYVKPLLPKTGKVPLHDPGGSLTWYLNPLWPDRAWQQTDRPTVARLSGTTGSTPFSGPMEVEIFENPHPIFQSRTDWPGEIGRSSLVICVRGWPLTLGELKRKLGEQWPKTVIGARKDPKGEDASNTLRHRLRALAVWRLRQKGMKLEEIAELEAVALLVPNSPPSKDAAFVQTLRVAAGKLAKQFRLPSP